MIISIVIPVYRGEKTLRELFERIQISLNRKYDYEIIFIYDGGKDASWEVIKDLHFSNPGIIRAYKFATNQGQHKALLYGLRLAKGDIIITMDEDLQHDPIDIPSMVQTLEEGEFDLLYGRFKDIKNTKVRILFSKLFRILFIRFIPYLNSYYSPYRAITYDLASKAAVMKDVYVFVDAYLSKISSNYGVLDLEHHESKSNGSSYSYYRLVWNTIYIILAYSRFVLYSMVTAISLLILYLVLLVAEPGADDMRISLSKIIIVLAVTLLLLGCIGEYTNRRNLRFSSKPVKIDEILT